MAKMKMNIFVLFTKRTNNLTSDNFALELLNPRPQQKLHYSRAILGVQFIFAATRKATLPEVFPLLTFTCLCYLDDKCRTPFFIAS